MTLLVDAGALIAYERHDQHVKLLIEDEVGAGRAPLTHGGIVGQVWRGSRQVKLARLLPGLEIRPLDGALGRDSGLILAADGSADVLDAALVALAKDHDTIVTSDPVDIRRLAGAAGVRVAVISV